MCKRVEHCFPDNVSGLTNRRTAMVLRVWRGYTAPQDADTYEVMLGETILPGIHRVEGYRGAYLARLDGDHEVEFLTITLWESMDAVRVFSTDGGAVIHDAARPLLITLRPILGPL
jgi:heme-degrading monooxygenase HmoA